MPKKQRINLSLHLAILAIAGTSNAEDSTNPSVPVGELTAFPSTVQTGTYPTLTWAIEYPERVTDIIDITPPGKITPKEDLYMDIRVLGAAIQSGSHWLKVQAWVRADGSNNWRNFFYNYQPNVDPTRIYYTKFVRKNRANHFGGRYRSGNSWSHFYNTTSSTQNIIALVDGDSPPDYAPAYNQGDIEAFLEPYLDENGDISIGPMDVIILWELYSTNPGSNYFDMQDLVLLVTFRRVQS